jgi:hypothetical protein
MSRTITDPRTGKPAVIYNVQAYWEEVSKIYVCDHVETEVRLWTNKNGSPAVVAQCLRCGTRRGNPIKVDDRSTIPPADATLEPMFHDEVKRRKQEIEVKYIDMGRKADDNYLAEYDAYLKTDAWRRRRDLVLKRCGGVCEGCGEAPATEVHHASYEHVFEEFLFELLGLCHACHVRLHAAPAETADAEWEEPDWSEETS